MPPSLWLFSSSTSCRKTLLGCQMWTRWAGTIVLAGKLHHRNHYHRQNGCKLSRHHPRTPVSIGVTTGTLAHSLLNSFLSLRCCWPSSQYANNKSHNYHHLQKQLTPESSRGCRRHGSRVSTLSSKSSIWRSCASGWPPAFLTNFSRSGTKIILSCLFLCRILVCLTPAKALTRWCHMQVHPSYRYVGTGFWVLGTRLHPLRGAGAVCARCQRHYDRLTQGMLIGY